MRFQNRHYQRTLLNSPTIGSQSSASLDQWVLLPSLAITHWRADHESQQIMTFSMHRQCYMWAMPRHTQPPSFMVGICLLQKRGWAYPLSTLNTSELRCTGVHHKSCTAIFPKKVFCLLLDDGLITIHGRNNDAHPQTSVNKAILTQSGNIATKGDHLSNRSGYDYRRSNAPWHHRAPSLHSINASTTAMMAQNQYQERQTHLLMTWSNTKLRRSLT